MNAPMPRQSIFPGAAGPLHQAPISTSHLQSLHTCLEQLHQTVQVLSHTNSFLDEATSDIPRLHTALTSKRHYDVVTEAQVNEAKKQIEDEIRPHLNELMRRGEEGVEKEEANARRARNKVSQLTTRLEQVLATQQIQIASQNKKQASTVTAEEELAAEEEQRQVADLQRVRRRRQQLEQELKELEAEVDRTEAEVKQIESRG